MAQDWRYILQRVPSGEFIDLDLPLSGATINRAINAPGAISGNIPEGYRHLLDSKGDLAIEEWGTMIHAELDGEIVQSAIVDTIELDGDVLHLDAGGWTMMATDTPWVGKDRSYILEDPLEIFRDIWSHMQSFPDGNLGVKVDPTTSPITVGTPESKALVRAKAQAEMAKVKRQMELDRYTLSKNGLSSARAALLLACGLSTSGAVYMSTSAPTGVKRKSTNVWINTTNQRPYKFVSTKWVEATGAGPLGATSVYLLRNSDHIKALALYNAAKKSYDTAVTQVKNQSSGEAVPLKLAFHETTNLQSVIDDLVTNTPFQYMEDSYWDGDVIKYRLKVGYPTLGARRENLRFEIGQNVKAVPKIGLGDYASEVVLFGAGEGSSKIHARISSPTGRLRRVHVSTNKDLTSKSRAEQAARPILKELIGGMEIDTLVVMDTPLAPMRSYEPGDEVFVLGDAGWADLDMWVRITEITINPDNTDITLKVVTV